MASQPAGGTAVGPHGPDRAEPPTIYDAGGLIEVELPIRLTIRLGAARQLAPTPPRIAQTGSGEALLLERLGAADYADREGFDREFLGHKVPLPRIRRQPRFGRLLRIARPSRPEDVAELRYRHYSVLMNATRRMAYLSACNIDFEAAFKASRATGTQTWRLDPRIDPADQLDDTYYRANDYDRGHLTRRDDAAWGATQAEANASSKDTFHHTNAAPQFTLFNESNEFTGAGLDLWGDLENFISAQGAPANRRLSVLNGPVFGQSDKPLKDILVPLAFFKVVIWNDGGRPGAVGFVLEQGALIAALPEEAIDPGRFAVRQTSIAAIEAMVDVDFGPIKGWDRLAAARPEEALEGGPLQRLADIELR